jgi:hypothetical protein
MNNKSIPTATSNSKISENTYHYFNMTQLVTWRRWAYVLLVYMDNIQFWCYECIQKSHSGDSCDVERDFSTVRREHKQKQHNQLQQFWKEDEVKVKENSLSSL